MTHPAKKPSTGRLYGGLSGAQRRQERRARFIEAGIECFGRAGYGATTTRSLCSEAGLTQRYFYEAFKDMEDLFIEVSTLLGDRLKAAILGAMESAGEVPDDIARAALTAYFKTMQDDPRAARILLIEIFMVSPRTGLLARGFMEEFSRLLHGIFEAIYPELSEQGISTSLLAASLIGATHHIALSWTQGGYAEPLEQVVTTALLVYRTAERESAPRPWVAARS